MNKEELLAEVRKLELILNLGERHGDIDSDLADDVWHLIDCIDKLDEPQKPIIPQFVADCIEEERAKIIDWHTEIPERFFLILGYKLHYTALASTNVSDWVFDGNEEKLYQALKYGYKVEKEKKYRVRAGNRYVRFNLDGSIIGVKKDNSIVCLERLTKLPFDYKKAVESGIITLEEVTE